MAKALVKARQSLQVRRADAVERRAVKVAQKEGRSVFPATLKEWRKGEVVGRIIGGGEVIVEGASNGAVNGVFMASRSGGGRAKGRWRPSV